MKCFLLIIVIIIIIKSTLSDNYLFAVCFTQDKLPVATETFVEFVVLCISKW